MNNEFDIIIVGNGVLAYSSAFYLMLENSSTKIAIVGPKEKSGCASLAAGAMLNSFAEVEKETLTCKYLKYKFDLNRQAAKMWVDWAELLNKSAGDKLLKLNFGTYIINNTKADDFDDENYSAVINTLNQYKEDYYEANPQDIKGLSPDPRSRSLKAIYIPNEGYLKSTDLPTIFEKIFSKNSNVCMFNDTATKIYINENGIKEISTQNEITLTSKNVLIACGAKSQELINQIPEISNKIPKLFYGVGSSMVVESEGVSPEKVLRTPNRGLACGIHLVPYTSDICYIGATNFISPVPEYSPRMSSIHGLMTSSMEQINTKLYKAKIKKILIGHRPTTADTFPLIGKTSVKGLWILSGTKRDGLHMSPLYGKYISDSINGKNESYKNLFPPERDLIHTSTKEEGIIKAIKHLKSAAYQHELQLPKSGWEEMLNDTLRNKIEAIYNTCNITDYGIPPEMLDMYKYGHVVSLKNKNILATNAY